MDNVSVLLVTMAVVFGPVMGLAALLNARDRRGDRLLGRVAAQFSPRALRSDVAVRVSTGLFTRRSRVEVSVGAWATESTWPVVARLASTLPAHAALRVNGALPAPRPTWIRVDALPAPRRAMVPGPGSPVPSTERRAA